jgi:predicted GIY-YIG superfamily endonuclease
MNYDKILETAPHPVVYSIEFPNGMFYVGRSVDVARRAKKHFQTAMLHKHDNLALNRCFMKYKDQVVWDIVRSFDSAEEAVDFESAYIEEFWEDPMFLNQKRGDKIDALYNERRHTKPVWYMNPYTGGMWRDETASTMRKVLGQEGYGKPKKWGHIAKGNTPEECRAEADRILRGDFKKICLQVHRDSTPTCKAMSESYLKKHREKLRIKAIKRKMIVKNLNTGRVWLSRKSDLTAAQSRVRTEGVRPWSEFNVRGYGQAWAEFKPAKQGWCDAKSVVATSPDGTINTYESVGTAVRSLFEVENTSRKKHLCKSIRLAIKRGGSAYGYKWKYKK